MKSILYMIRNQLCFLVVIIALFIIVISGNKKEAITTYDVSNVSSIQAVHLVSKYNPETVQVIHASSISEVVRYGKTNPVVFKGTMTAYGPDCVGCTGRVSCPPGTRVNSQKIDFKDNQYGTVKILAADKNIPCGTIVKVTGLYGEPVMGIVLDRGGVIKGTLMDLLQSSEAVSSIFGRRSVTYEIMRWGW